MTNDIDEFFGRIGAEHEQHDANEERITVCNHIRRWPSLTIAHLVNHPDQFEWEDIPCRAVLTSDQSKGLWCPDCDRYLRTCDCGKGGKALNCTRSECPLL